MIRWPISQLKEPLSSLCAQVNGVYFDILQYTDERAWFCMWDGKKHWAGFPSREAAVCWFDEAEVALSRGQEPDAPQLPAKRWD